VYGQRPAVLGERDNVKTGTAHDVMSHTLKLHRSTSVRKCAIWTFKTFG